VEGVKIIRVLRGAITNYTPPSRSTKWGPSRLRLSSMRFRGDIFAFLCTSWCSSRDILDEILMFANEVVRVVKTISALTGNVMEIRR
jgi:hypothetical protein